MNEDTIKDKLSSLLTNKLSLVPLSLVQEETNTISPTAKSDKSPIISEIDSYVVDEEELT